MKVCLALAEVCTPHFLPTLTCNVERDGSLNAGVAAQAAGEGGAVVLVDNRHDAHAALSLAVSFAESHRLAVPQPHQLRRVVLRSVAETHQRHGSLQLGQDDSFAVHAGH